MNPVSGVQTLDKALALLEACSSIHSLEELTSLTGMSRSTTHRLLTALVEHKYLRHLPREGYFLGPRLITLGFQAYSETQLTTIARPYLENLSDTTKDTVHLAVREGRQLVYIDKIPGVRQLQMLSRIGERGPLQCTGVGKALLTGLPQEKWADFFDTSLCRTPSSITNLEDYVNEIRLTAQRGYSLDMEENEIGIRCIGVPVHDASGDVVAAISLTGATIYMDEERVHSLISVVKETALNISAEMGWSGKPK